MIRRMRYLPAATVAAGFGVSLRTARKWMGRYREGGVEALADKSSRPKRCRDKLTKREYKSIYALRKERLIGDEIALRLSLCRSSVFRALRRLGCLGTQRHKMVKTHFHAFGRNAPKFLTHVDF